MKRNSWITRHLMSLAVLYLAKVSRDYPEIETASNNLTLFFEDKKRETRINVEYIKQGRYSSHEIMVEYEKALRDIVRGDINVEDESKIKYLFSKFKRKI